MVSGPTVKQFICNNIHTWRWSSWDRNMSCKLDTKRRVTEPGTARRAALKAVFVYIHQVLYSDITWIMAVFEFSNDKQTANSRNSVLPNVLQFPWRPHDLSWGPPTVEAASAWNQQTECNLSTAWLSAAIANKIFRQGWHREQPHLDLTNLLKLWIIAKLKQ
jgi:hypothetical protein